MSEDTTQEPSDTGSEAEAEKFAASILGEEPEVTTEETTEPTAQDQVESEEVTESESTEPQEETATTSESETEEETESLDQPTVEPEVETPSQELVQETQEKVLETYTKPSRIENRITQLFMELHADETVNVAAVLEEVKGYTKEEKHEALKNLLAQKKVHTETPYTEEDQDILIEAEVEERQSEWKREQEERDFQSDLVKTLEDHPELRSDDKKFDKPLHDAVEVLVEKGMKASEALSLVNGQREEAKKLALEELQKQTEKEKQKALSGTMSSSASGVSEKESPKTKADEFAESILGFQAKINKQKQIWTITELLKPQNSI